MPYCGLGLQLVYGNRGNKHQWDVSIAQMAGFANVRILLWFKTQMLIVRTDCEYRLYHLRATDADDQIRRSPPIPPHICTSTQ